MPAAFHSVSNTIVNLLKEGKFWFEAFEHEPVRTSEEAAKVRSGYSLKQGAKAIIVRVKQSNSQKFFVMLVLPGDKRFDSEKVKKLFSAKDIRFATEPEVEAITKGVKPGGVPPLGNLFNLKVYVDKSLLRQEKIVFNAGDQRFSVGMLAKDYQGLVKPEVVEIT